MDNNKIMEWFTCTRIGFDLNMDSLNTPLLVIHKVIHQAEKKKI